MLLLCNNSVCYQKLFCFVCHLVLVEQRSCKTNLYSKLCTKKTSQVSHSKASVMMLWGTQLWWCVSCRVMLFIALHFNSFCYLFVDVVGKVARNNSCVTNKLFSWFYRVQALKHLQVWVLTDTLASGDWLTEMTRRIPPGRRLSHDSMSFCMDPFCAALHLMQSRQRKNADTMLRLTMMKKSQSEDEHEYHICATGGF